VSRSETAAGILIPKRDELPRLIHGHATSTIGPGRHFPIFHNFVSSFSFISEILTTDRIQICFPGGKDILLSEWLHTCNLWQMMFVLLFHFHKMFLTIRTFSSRIMRRITRTSEELHLLANGTLIFCFA
jgi:hypothetical protein